MLSRRGFIGSSLGYSIFAGLSPYRSVFGATEPTARSTGRSTGRRPHDGAPLALADGVNRSVLAHPIVTSSGDPSTPLPFLEAFHGDAFPQPGHQVLFNKEEYLGPDLIPPTAEEFVDLVVIGGGLGGLTSAYNHRDRDVVVLDFAPRFGGNSRGEVWNNVAYSQGGAYLIEPCPGNPIDTLINELSLRDVLRPFSGDDTVELGGKMLARFWSGQAASPREQRAYDTYRRQMLYYAKHYPDMPTEDGSIDEYTKKLDTHSLKQEIESWIDGDVPPLMAAAIQYYCYSSFCAGWEEVSAAAGINFLAAEEYDLWVFPGGLGQVSHRLWQKIRDDAGPESFRPQCLVFDVRSHKKGVQVTYLDEEQKVRTLVGKAAAVACPKKFYQYVQDDLPTERKAAFDSVLYRSYVVANVLINHPAPDNFYDLFLLHNGQYPQNANEASNMHRIADALAATWVTKGGPRSVLTCYWPLPFDPTGLHHAFGSWGDGGAESLRRQAATQIHRILRVIDVPASAVEQIRVTRWGHAMPISQTGIYNAGLHNLLRAPIDDKIFFVHSDNWALPAFETTVLEAFHYRDAIDRAISVG